ncbi:glycosyltransferase family 4 protein [Ottowia sp. VDI28]|uniref:glycosyltransferase family 4 protein n=1 Tax=Ottowia sp. VDI28 TaxID=3133968 RepID=UPI003C2EFE9F
MRQLGIRAEITWLPLRAEYAPWTVPIPQAPTWATIAHVNTWLHTRFLPPKLPIVATIHHAVHHPDTRIHKSTARAIYHRWWIAPNERRVLRLSAQVVAVSQFAASSTRQAVLNIPLQVIYNGVDTTSFCPSPASRPSGTPFRLLYVGSWKPLKGVGLLPTILRELGDGFELHYTGGPAAENDKPHMPPNMHDIGRLQGDAAVAKAMQQADALLFPSKSEGFGLVAAEAMACGLPVVAARSTSLEELIIDGQTGILCPIDDAVAFANSIRALCKDSAKRDRLSHAGRARAINQFSEELMLASHLKLYRTLLKP